RWRRDRRCCCWTRWPPDWTTTRSGRWTRSSAGSATAADRCCWWSTTSPWCGRWPTGWWCWRVARRCWWTRRRRWRGIRRRWSTTWAARPRRTRRTGRTFMADLLEFDGVRSGYGDLVVLRDVSFSVAESSITVLLGRNGAGKTTLLRTV